MPKSRNILILISWAVALSTPGLAVGVTCDNTGVCYLLRPIQSDSGAAPLVRYYFKYRAAKNGAPTVVFAPGGPGETSMAGNPASTGGGMPDDFGVILTDPRFVGANRSPTPTNFKTAISSEGVADDLLTAIEALGIENYILYGQSYGTIPITIAAARATHPPRAVVLEGTVGRGMQESEYEAGFYQEWNAYVAKLAPATIHHFRVQVRSFITTGEFTADNFGDLIQGLLISRHSSLGGDNLDEMVQLIARGPKSEARDAIKSVVGAMEAAYTADESDLFHGIINCREVFADGHPDTSDLSFDATTALLKSGGTANCPKYVSEAHLYNSQAYQIRSPIVYVQGADDPATPRWQTEYHFTNQLLASQKLIVSVPDGSHAPLHRELQSCAPHFWQHLTENPAKAQQALAPCFAR